MTICRTLIEYSFGPLGIHSAVLIWAGVNLLIWFTGPVLLVRATRGGGVYLIWPPEASGSCLALLIAQVKMFSALLHPSLPTVGWGMRSDATPLLGASPVRGTACRGFPSMKSATAEGRSVPCGRLPGTYLGRPW